MGPPAAGLDQLEQVFQSVVSSVVGLAFFVVLAFIVWAGIKYLTSGGEPKAVQAAHQVITWALIGVLFLAIAWLVLQLIENFTGIKVSVFDAKSLCGVGNQFCTPSPTPAASP